ncbi:MAG: DUF503 domain-containing protein [Candidatus Marinimicrobia bacterium]|nr:DUF503 domain-containing protein [Candidatus Neomarinimicrobiota bacterium]MCF7851431.1 DUF503 domain-containing protein [Candidatus Neomarinimicrobiota bacterium]
MRNRFNISVAEVGDLDKWQVATLAIVMVSNDSKHVEAQFQKIDQFIEASVAGEAYVTARELSFT